MSQYDNDQLGSVGPLEQHALDWIVRLTSGEATDEDRQAFLRWRRLSPEHERAARSAISLWRQIGMAPAADRRPRASISRRLFLKTGAIAATAAGATVLGSEFGFLPTWNQAFADYRTLAGEQQRIQLADDTIVELNTRTALALESESVAWSLRLLAGEAAFTVHGRSGDPLSVLAGQLGVQARHAAFVVRMDGVATRVSCVSGSITLANQDQRPLHAAQQAIFDRDRLAAIVPIDPDIVSSWRDGRLVFRNETLAHVIAELNRYRKGTILLADSRLAGRRVSGIFHLARTDEALEHLHSALNIPVRYFSRYVVVVG